MECQTDELKELRDKNVEESSFQTESVTFAMVDT